MTRASSTPPGRRPTGRRPGESGTREAILDSARDLFAERGYAGASLRAIASRAGVDSALIRHFFGDKETLFATTMADRTVIPARLAAALAGPVETLGARVADTYLRLWREEDTRPILMGLVRSAMTSRHGIALLLEIVGGRIQQSVPFPPGKDGRMRGFALAASHLFGTAVALHILRLPMLTEMTHEDLVEALAPTRQRYLAGDDL